MVIQPLPKASAFISLFINMDCYVLLVFPIFALESKSHRIVKWFGLKVTKYLLVSPILPGAGASFTGPGCLKPIQLHCEHFQ